MFEIFLRTKKRQSYLPEFVYGSMDGLVTTFAIVTGSVGASLPAGIILIMGFANVFADAFSMGASSYLAAVSEDPEHRKMHEKHPVRKAVVTFLSFVIIGLIPLLPFVVAYIIPEFAGKAIQVSVITTMIAFGVIGYISGAVLNENKFVTTIRNFTIGGAAAAISFGVGYALVNLFGI
ncbi:VIT1/CCC1 transporter family protein [Candidatus Kaiserbacteria bacterium]|nr:MAG: VIT1/CCC1 transporter family protein [Candidatus Kaiserbacteria bacterium]